LIELRNVTKKYSDTVLENVSVSINDGDVVAIIGPSGCGKSTLLNCFNVLEQPTSGEVIFDGVNIADHKCKVEQYRQKIGIVFQSYNLFAHRTVLENVVDPQILILKRGRQEAVDKAMECLKSVGMAEKKFSYPNELSGGQKQRAAIARTIAMDPEIILMDEPTSALDPTMVGEVEYVIKQLANSGRTMLIVTHSMKLARQVATRILYLDEKGIYEDGPTEQIFTAPKKEKTRIFIEQLKRLEIIIKSTENDIIAEIQKIDEFGLRFGLDFSRITNMRRLFEEICVVGLMPSFKEGEIFKAVFEYSEKEDKLSFKLYHQREPLQMETILDDISLSIVKAAMEKIDFQEYPGETI